MTPRARRVGALCLAATYIGLVTAILAYRHVVPATVAGVAVGTLLGLASMVFEIHVVERAARQEKGDTAGATFQTFALRLAVVAPLTLAFQRVAGRVDAESFAVTYVATFFAYLCWLTWRAYHTPVAYRRRAKTGGAPRVVVKCRRVALAGSAR